MAMPRPRARRWRLVPKHFLQSPSILARFVAKSIRVFHAPPERNAAGLHSHAGHVPCPFPQFLGCSCLPGLAIGLNLVTHQRSFCAICAICRGYFWAGAGERNRTAVISLEGGYFTLK